MNKIINLFFIIIGFIALSLGIVGIVIPVLPTTPFFLLTLFCFARGSARFHNWFLSSNLYKKYLEEFVRTRAMTWRAKLYLCLPASALMLVSFIFVSSWIVRCLIVFAIMFMWWFFTFRIKTIPRK